MFWKKKPMKTEEWSYKQPTKDGFYWYVEDGYMAVAYVNFLSKDLQYQRQTIAEVQFLNGAGHWPKREIERCNGMWMEIQEPS